MSHWNRNSVFPRRLGGKPKSSKWYVITLFCVHLLLFSSVRHSGVATGVGGCRPPLLFRPLLGLAQIRRKAFVTYRGYPMYVYCNFYCSPAKKHVSDAHFFGGWRRHWRGLTVASHHLHVFNYLPSDFGLFEEMCRKADTALFSAVLNDSTHVLNHLLPPVEDVGYNLRPRTHDRCLPGRLSFPTEEKFL